MKISRIQPEYVEFVPKELNEGVLYISEQFGIVAHKCACGCGEKVVTPLSPAQWQLQSHGDTVSIKPSIGNWSYQCQSHYWIRRNRIVWAVTLTPRQIARIQERDMADLRRQIDLTNQERERGLRVRSADDTLVHGRLISVVRWIRDLFRQ